MIQTPKHSGVTRWAALCCSFAILAPLRLQATVARYNVTDLRVTYGNDLLNFRGMSKGGILTGNNSTDLVQIQNGVRTNVKITDEGGYLPFNDNGIAYNKSTAPLHLRTLTTQGVNTDTGYVPQGNNLHLEGQNRIGTVVGQEVGLPDINDPSGGFIYDPVNGGRVVQQLGGVTNVSSFHAVNDIGQIGGYGITSGQGHLYLWTPGQPAISLANTTNGKVEALNNAAQVVGEIGSHSFFWDHGTLTRPGTRLVEDPAHPGTFNEIITEDGAVDISEDGVVVGGASVRSVPGYTAPLRPLKGYLWTLEGGLVWLDDLVDPSLGIQIIAGLNIADDGSIFATGYKTGSNARQYFLLSPVPEPTAGALLLVGMFLGTYRRR